MKTVKIVKRKELKDQLIDALIYILTATVIYVITKFLETLF